MGLTIHYTLKSTTKSERKRGNTSRICGNSQWTCRLTAYPKSPILSAMIASSTRMAVLTIHCDGC